MQIMKYIQEMLHEIQREIDNTDHPYLLCPRPCCHQVAVLDHLQNGV